MKFRFFCRSVRIKQFASFSEMLCHYFIVHFPGSEMSNKHDILKLNVVRPLAVAWYDARLGLIFNSGEFQFDTHIVHCLRCLLKTIFGAVCIQTFICCLMWCRLMSDVLFRGSRLEYRLRIGAFHGSHKKNYGISRASKIVSRTSEGCVIPGSESLL
jgi:hypothetical protein